MKAEHPSWEMILDHLESEAAEKSEVQIHLRTCQECADRERSARRLLRLFASGRLPEPPDELVQRTMEHISSETERRASSRAQVGANPDQLEPLEPWIDRLGSKLNEVWAVLTADSLVPSPVLRGAPTLAPRMLLYSTEAYSISISMAPSTAIGSGRRSEFMEIRGQIAPTVATELPAGGTARLRWADRQAEASLSEFGEFAFLEVPAQASRPRVEAAAQDSDPSAFRVIELEFILGDSRIRLAPIIPTTE